MSVTDRSSSFLFVERRNSRDKRQSVSLHFNCDDDASLVSRKREGGSLFIKRIPLFFSLSVIQSLTQSFQLQGFLAFLLLDVDATSMTTTSKRRGWEKSWKKRERMQFKSWVHYKVKKEEREKRETRSWERNNIKESLAAKLGTTFLIPRTN